MNIILEKVYANSPNILQNIMVTMFDVLMYSKRRGGAYKYWLGYHRKYWNAGKDELLREQKRRLNEFIEYASGNSDFYKARLKNIGRGEINQNQLKNIPYLTKRSLSVNVEKIRTVAHSKSYVAHTGGTTGISMTTYFTWDGIQERQAILDLFRAQYGYQLGIRIGWFSGKTLLSKTDIKKKRFWKTDYYHNIRYYSTFHTADKNLAYYIENINTYKPKYLSGFPSSVYEIANYGLKNELSIGYRIECFFPTSESITHEYLRTIKEFFKCEVADQYASAEGAPFIFQRIEDGKLHYYCLSGIIEVVEADGSNTIKGEMIVTSFTTKGTPLIRYQIGDRVTFDKTFNGYAHGGPIVQAIEGRINDYVYSEETGKINLGNISNCVKYVKGVKRFQIIQNKLDMIQVLVEADVTYTEIDEARFLKELKDRMGLAVDIEFRHVDHIPRESSGKYRIVKNNIAQ
jgi:phenylacetate-CoA ligase